MTSRYKQQPACPTWAGSVDWSPFVQLGEPAALPSDSARWSGLETPKAGPFEPALVVTPTQDCQDHNSRVDAGSGAYSGIVAPSGTNQTSTRRLRACAALSVPVSTGFVAADDFTVMRDASTLLSCTR